MKIRRILKWCIGIIIFLAIIIGAFAFKVYHNAASTFEEMYTPLERTSTNLRNKPIALGEEQPFSILLLGVDERGQDIGRSDTIIVLTVNPKTKNTLMVSIPRDTYANIVGKNKNDKINHAYAFGGMEMSMNSVEKLLNIPIDYVAKINMEGFEQIIDTIGGVEIQNETAFKQDNHYFKQGPITLDGIAALDYVRMRKEDPQGDFGRQNRQKLVIQSIIEKGTALSTMMKYQDIFKILGSNISTNLTFDQLINLQQNYRQSFSNIKQIQFEKGENKVVNNIWYYMMDPKELAHVTVTLRKHLGLL